jgi:hypothetical protein
MPNSSVITATMIGLMGLSSAGYLGVKANENSAPASALASKPTITYNPSVNNFTVGSAITPLTPVSTGGNFSSYSIDPPLGNGLLFNTATGVISGQPAGPMVATNYTITATGPAGPVTATIRISAA